MLKANRALLYGLFFLLPMDYFLPTSVLREFGSRPSMLVIGLITVTGFFTITGEKRSKLLLYGAIFAVCVLISYVTYQCFLYEEGNYFKNSLEQFIFHSALACFTGCSIFILSENSGLFRQNYQAPLVFAAVAQILILTAEFLTFDAQSYGTGFFSNFRLLDGSYERPSGLFSEPSMFGVFSAIYSMALFSFAKCSTAMIGRLCYSVIGVSLVVACVLISARTFYLVFFVVAILGLSGNYLKSLLIVIAACGLFALFASGSIDINSDNSSAMRIGSNLVGLNAFLAYPSPIGIAPGQFHFEYKLENFPDFLLYSNEALLQAKDSAEYRASTYSLPIRILVEFGFIGLLIFACFVISLLKSKPTEPFSEQFNVLKIMFVGSLAFLLTQDTYSYPMLIFSSAGLLNLREHRGGFNEANPI